MIVSYILNKGAELVGKKWRASVLWYLIKGPLRFSQLKRLMPSVSVKVLSEVLHEMEGNHLIIRKQYNSIPVKVTYEIHPDAHGFVEANVLCTVRIGQYMVQNADRLKISSEDITSLKAFLTENEDILNKYKLKTEPSTV